MHSDIIGKDATNSYFNSLNATLLTLTLDSLPNCDDNPESSTICYEKDRMLVVREIPATIERGELLFH